MKSPTYPPARTVAERIRSGLPGVPATFGPAASAAGSDASVIESVISAAFWASLRREEGKAPTISLAFAAPEHVDSPLTFGTHLPLDPDVLARLAPAVERPGIHLGVWSYGDRLDIWGTTRSVPIGCFVLEVVAPGLLVVKYRREQPTRKFVNVAVLEGADVKFVARRSADGPSDLKALNPLLTFYTSAGVDESDHVLVRLAISMRAHGRGGSLLVVPRHTNEWKKSIVQPISYAVAPPFSEIDGLADPDALRSAIDALAGATAVDGATVISDHFELLAFGVKIIARDASRRVGHVLVTEPVEDVRDSIVEPAQLGNTRHLSAAQFVHDQRDAISLVASQDGRFTVFAWSGNGIVHAHRLETLLL